VHVLARVWRLITMLALVTFALPLASLVSPTGAHAQALPGSRLLNSNSVGVAAVSPAVAFNPIGTDHTVTFQCGTLTGNNSSSSNLPDGCYNVQISATDITTGSGINITQATCGGVALGATASTVDCSKVANPICAQGTFSVFGSNTNFGNICTTHTGATLAADQLAQSTATATINPGAPHAYVVTFTGYVPTLAGGACPAGTTGPTRTTLTIGNSGDVTSVTSPQSLSVVVGTQAADVCSFSVSAQKKYVEVTNIALTAPAGCPGGTLLFAEGLKNFFGPQCTVVASVSGTVVLKTGVDCAGEPTTGTSAPAEFGADAVYSCTNGNLSVTGVTGSTNGTGSASLGNVPLVFTASGAGSFTRTGTLNGLCAGSNTAPNSQNITTTAASGATATFCPTGPGTASVKACLGTPRPNNQPPVCSNTISTTFRQTAQRVVPYVRWAGEKIELTKCFGVGLRGLPVEFLLKGNNPGLNATLIPAGLTSSGTTGGVTNQAPSASTVFTTTDSRGCATVLGLADGEGAMYVDAAIFNTNGASGTTTGPIVNEHAFEVFYLKFDHLDLENIKFQTYTSAQALLPYLSFAAATPVLNGASTFNTSFRLPGPFGSGSVAGGGTYPVALCSPDFVRAVVHGYFEISGDPSGRPEAQVAIPGAASGSAGSYALPKGRWVLPEDWPLLATFAGFGGGSPLDITPSSVLAWDLNSGWVFNPTGENPVFCGLASSTALGDGLLQGGNFPTGSINTATGADLGPCFGQDASQIGSSPASFYATAPGSLTGTQATNFNNIYGFCNGGVTAGFGPFDANRACTSPFPLTYTPAGANIIGTTTAQCTPVGTSPCVLPVNPDSTYLPNGTLNQYDAPMPPAQISFGITSGVGFLGQVNKTKLYQINFDTGAGTPCPQGYTLNAGTNTCQLRIDPNPFYAEAIPASPLIPPVTNNGGYLFNSFAFSNGVTSVTGTGGGSVAGVSTTATFASTSFSGNKCPVQSSNAGLGTSAAPVNCTVAGGLNLTNLGTGCQTGINGANATGNTIIVANGQGFAVGETLTSYSAGDATGNVTGTFTVTGVAPAPSFGSNAAELTLSGTVGSCVPAFTTVFVGTDFALPVANAAAFGVGTQLTVGPTSNGGTFTSTVTAVDTTNNLVFIDGSSALAVALGGQTCSFTFLSTCTPAGLVPAGLAINGGPLGSAAGARPTSLYPFWQFLSNPPTAGGTPNSATVYSDNHGEAVVSLNTNINNTTAVKADGTCPTGYSLVPAVAGQAATCLLTLGALGTMNLGNGTLANVATAIGKFSATNPGCVQTFASGTAAALTGATIGGSGPAAGQICVNALGGVEFGAAASLGSTTVQAVADYPYTRGEHAQIGSAPLVKVFTSAFAKNVTVSAGTAGPSGTTSYQVTVTATDVCGNPITGEPINVFALSGSGGGVVLAPLSTGGILSSSQSQASVLVNGASSANAGTATFSLEVLNAALGNAGVVVKVVFPFELLERFVTVIAGTVPGQTATVVYPPGYRMVGGPPGSDFSIVEALFSFDAGSQSYTDFTSSARSISSAAPNCTGFYGYFAASQAVSLPATSKAGDTAACTLKAGYNLVGNPFASPARLPTGTTGFYFNGTSYDTVSVIPTGGAVFIFNDGTLGTLTLTAA